MCLQDELSDTASLPTEESDQRVASVRSQFDQQVAQLQRDLEEARREVASAAAPADQLQQEKERLATENAELHTKVTLGELLFLLSLTLWVCLSP